MQIHIQNQQDGIAEMFEINIRQNPKLDNTKHTRLLTYHQAARTLAIIV